MLYKMHLSNDKKLRDLVHSIELDELIPNKNIFIALVSAVASQQLSTKVAAIIFARFTALYPKHKATPALVLATANDTLRAIGFSNQKVQYIKNIAQFAIDHKITYAYLNKMTDADIITYLTQIKGVGVWTVEMLLIFTLCRPDTFSLGDYGLQVSAKALYNLDSTNKKEFLKTVEGISSNWAPYRSYAARLLWNYKDGEK